jgi:hypothetical protein
MEPRSNRRVFGFLIVCAYSMASFLFIPFLPNSAARLAVSVWGAAASAAGAALAIYCIWRKREP